MAFGALPLPREMEITALAARGWMAGWMARGTMQWWTRTGSGIILVELRQ